MSSRVLQRTPRLRPHLRPPRVAPAEPRPRLPPAARRARTPLWAPAVRPGRVPAYDHALRYIRADARTLRAELAALKQSFRAAAAADAVAGRTHDAAAAAAYRAQRDRLAVLAAVNLPEVRWAFATGRFPFAQPVYRHLTEHKWRTDGALDLLMERLHQMHVVPDLLPALHPGVELRVQFPTAPGARGPRGFAAVEPGAFLRPAQTRAAPRLAATAFHAEPRLYTLLLLDPDVPDEATRGFQTRLHWLLPNIMLAGTRRITPLPAGPAALAYEPPHPQRGTPYHRYVLLLLAHARGAPLALGAPPPRARFDLRAFCAQHGLAAGGGGGGAHMWRAEWDADVSAVYRDVLGTPEPRYGRPRAPARYAQ